MTTSGNRTGPAFAWYIDVRKSANYELSKVSTAQTDRSQ